MSDNSSSRTTLSGRSATSILNNFLEESKVPSETSSFVENSEEETERVQTPSVSSAEVPRTPNSGSASRELLSEFESGSPRIMITTPTSTGTIRPNVLERVEPVELSHDFYETMSYDVKQIFHEWHKNATPESTREYYENLKRKWYRPFVGVSDPSPLLTFQLSLRNFGVSEKYSEELLEAAIAKNKLEVITVIEMVKDQGWVSELDTEDNKTHGEILSLIAETVYYSAQSLQSFHLTSKVLSNHIPNVTSDYAIGLFKRLDMSKMNDTQSFQLRMLDILYEKQYRRYGETCFARRMTEDGKFTYSWKEVMSIQDFVYQCISDASQNPDWEMATKKSSTIPTTIEFLKNCVEEKFPNLVKDRGVFAFRNGIYVACDDRENSTIFRDRFYPIGGKYTLDTSVAAAKYFDMDFPYEENFTEDGLLREKQSADSWMDIETPNFDRILDVQYKSEKTKDGKDDKEDDIDTQCEEIRTWAYVMIGRMLYNVGDLDKWQVFPYFQGVAGTGKGTLLKIPMLFYEACDVASMETNSERVFGIANLAKFIFIASEMRRASNIDQGVFQKMVSGETISTAVKFGKPKTIEWFTPGAGAGNESVFNDDSGSISRRFVVFWFRKVVPKDQSDPRLDDKLKANVPRLLLKCNRAYLWAINKYASKEIWSVLPRYFKNTSDRIAVETNHIKAFLNYSEDLEFGEDFRIKETELKQYYQQYCSKANIRSPQKFTETTSDEPFAFARSLYNVRIRYENTNEQGKKSRVRYIIGIRRRVQVDESEKKETTESAIEKLTASTSG